ncbi:MAG: hypothetical protein JNJ77_10410 [Planctomycetia bacterium]|nr:hypothetical protein [Planctomycetia bacterium]
MGWLTLDAMTALLLRITPSLFEWALILLPLTIYLLWLGFEVGRKKQPYVLTGKSDTWLLLFALSGFFLIGPFTWIISRTAEKGFSTYAIAYAIYLAVLILLAMLWLRSRKQSLVIYNIEATAFERVFRQALDSISVPYLMVAGHISFNNQQLLIDIDPTPSLFCVTLKWNGDKALWTPLENSLRTAMLNVTTERNPAGALIPLYAAVFLCFISMSTVLYVWYLAFVF